MSKPWKACKFCRRNDDLLVFDSPIAFGEHLRLMHSKIQDGLHVCLYGMNGTCSLMLHDGVNDRDYETHIARFHVFGQNKNNTANDSHQSDTLNAHHKNGHHSSQYSFGSSSEDDDRNRFTNSHRSNGTNKNNPNFPNPLKNSKFDLEVQPAKSDTNFEPEWTVYSSNQILASSINDPSKHRSYYDNLFTKDWGFTFVETSVTPFPTFKKPTKMVFDGYIKRVNRRSRLLNHKPALSREPSREDTASLNVPKLFFDESFDLEDSDTFTNLLHLFGFERSEDNLGNFFEQSSMSDIQSRLSEYLDVVEQDLANQIGRRSKDFFQVMSSMDSVMDKLIACIRQVSTIRSNCAKMDDYLVRPIGQNIVLTQARNSVRELLKKINEIATVHQAQPTIQFMLSKNDYAGALDLISTSQEVVTQELSGVISFRHLKLQLMEIERAIETMMNDEFVKYLTAEWNRPTGGVADKTFSIEEEKLLSIIYGMLKLQKFNFIDTFREEAFTAIKTNVKQTVIETLSSEDSIEVSGQESSVVKQTTLLSFPAWIVFLQRLFERLITLLRRVSSVYGVIRDGFEMVSANVSFKKEAANGDNGCSDDNMQNDHGIILQDDYKELKDNLKNILCSVCDFANSRCAQIIEYKVNDGALDKLEPHNFVNLINIIQKFTVECEKLCGKKSPNLKLVIQLQSNKLLKKFHEEHKNKLVQLLNLEQWKPVTNLSEQFQLLCSELVKRSANQPSNLVEAYVKFKNTKNQKSNKSSNLIILDENQFVLVNAVINLLYSILEYCQYSTFLPDLCGDFINCLIDSLKYFNARTSKLVLGADALKMSGLKTISARTLVICARCLAFVAEIIPTVKEHFRQLLEANNNRQTVVLKHFDEVVQLFENHYTNIMDKILDMVREVVRSNLTKWIAKAPVPSESFRMISQHLKRLHDNIHEFIPEKELIELFDSFHTIIIENFREQLLNLKIVNDGGPQHGFVTQELTFYLQSLNSLSIGPKLKLSMVELWPNQ